MNLLPRVALAALLFAGEASCLEGGEPAPTSFDFTHVTLALRYFGEPDENLLVEIAASPAGQHLKRHSDRTGYYPPDATALDVTRDLLKERPPPGTLEAVAGLVQAVGSEPARQALCMAEAARFLPPEAVPVNPLHVTWGYDIGVAMDGHASLNFAHPHFLQDPEEVWFYCIHEVHHSGLMRLHPMPRVAEIGTVRELYEFVRYATFLEGLAVHAAREQRTRLGALAADPDYVKLTRVAELERTMADYDAKLAWLGSQVGLALSDTHWNVVERMSSGDRLWYVAGAAMAAAIEQARGREGLLEAEKNGPDAFFAAYEAASTP